MYVKISSAGGFVCVWGGGGERGGRVFVMEQEEGVKGYLYAPLWAGGGGQNISYVTTVWSFIKENVKIMLTLSIFLTQ